MPAALAFWYSARALGSCGLEVLDALLVQRMRAQEGEPLAAAVLAVVFGEPLPERDRRRRVVAGARHVEQPDVIGLRLVLAAVGQQHADLARHAVRLPDQRLRRLALAGNQRARHVAAELRDHLLAHPFGAVMRGGVGDLVADHRRQPGLVLGDGQDAGVHAHLAAGQTPGVGLRALEQHELPLRVGQVGDRGDALARALHHRVGLRVAC